jgi:molecular chaperone DnaK
MSTPVIGIDLGTTNSVVAYTDEAGLTHVIADENGDRIVPSVIHFTSGGEMVVGRHAKDYAKVEPERVASVFKRGMGDATFLPDEKPFVVDGKTYSPEELSSIVLRKLAGMAEAHFGAPARRAVITVPHYFGEPERAATRAAGEIAGLEVLRVINEPTAAAIAHGLDGNGAASGRLMVFDLGGGTFDVTVVEYGGGRDIDVVAGDGDRELGGADIDAAIVERMREFVDADRGIDITDDPWLNADASARAEEMKKELSTSPSSTKPLAVGGRPAMFALSRDEFAGLIEEQIGFVDDAVRNALDKVDGKPLDTVLMVGGSSRIPLFQELARDITGLEPQLTKNLDEDVARGAAMLGAKLGGTLDPRSELASMPTPTDAASHALGLLLVRDDGVTGYNEVIISEGTPIPHSMSRTFGAAADGQTEIEVVLNEGRDEDLTFVRKLGTSSGRFSRPVGRGHPLRCEFEYTADQLVVVNMYDGESNEHICELKVEHTGLLDAQAKEDARAFLAKSTVR